MCGLFAIVIVNVHAMFATLISGVHALFVLMPPRERERRCLNFPAALFARPRCVWFLMRGLDKVPGGWFLPFSSAMSHWVSLYWGRPFDGLWVDLEQ